ncbi:MAG: hypothetical protein JNJ45_08140 [Chthonomonas sp.]|nr:hypothetical protein [Chthonomonas sp.]
MAALEAGSDRASWWDRPLAGFGWPRVLVCLAAAIVIAAFLWSYETSVAPLHSYIGYFWNPPPAEYTMLAAVLAWLPSLVIPLEFRKPSDLAVSLLYPTFVIPSAFLPFHVLKSPAPEMLPIVLVAHLGYWSLLLMWRTPGFRLQPPVVSRQFLMTALVMGTILCALAVAGANGFRVNLSFVDLYERRLAARESASAGVGYAMAFLASSFAPLCVAIGIEKKRPLLIGAGAFGIIAIFSFTGTKSSIFTPLLMMIILVIIGRPKNQQFKLLAWLAALMALGTLLWTQAQIMSLNNLLNYRMVASRGVGMTHYYKVFDGNQINMGDSAFAPAFGIQPAPPKSFTVGSQYGYSEQDNYNAGIWAAGFANFGVLGVVLASVFAGLTLKLFDAFAARGYRLTCFLMAGLVSVFWLDIGFENSLITQGLVLTLPFLFFLVASKDRAEAHA